MKPEERLVAWKDVVEKELERVLSGGDSVLFQAMRYAVLGGGKRFRPLLVFASGDCFAVPRKALLPFACGLELIHNYSLIHDDLPAMDDDDFRRGKPSCHRAFGEDIALLAGDGLLTLAFEVMAGTVVPEAMGRRKEEAIQVVSRAAGVSGMIGGQFLDITLHPARLTARKFKSLILKKTGALIVAAVEIGAVLGGAATPVRRLLVDFGRKVGLAFQIRDDIHDSRKRGKKKGPERPSAVALFGMEGARKELSRLVGEAVACLDRALLKAPELRFLARSLLSLKGETSHA